MPALKARERELWMRRLDPRIERLAIAFTCAALLWVLALLAALLLRDYVWPLIVAAGTSR